MGPGGGETVGRRGQGHVPGVVVEGTLDESERRQQDGGKEHDDLERRRPSLVVPAVRTGSLHHDQGI
jgi:hypothetical protein